MNINRWALCGAVVGGLAISARAQDKTLVYYMPSGSMKPTIRPNDRIWVQRTAYKSGNPRRSDIAIIELANSFAAPWLSNPAEKVLFVKRVIAVPGDRVEMVNGRLKINGSWQKDAFAHWDGKYTYSLKIVKGRVYSQDSGGEWTLRGERISNEETIAAAHSDPIPPHKYLVLGDNRSNSNDSHVFGLVDRDRFQARVAGRIWPNPCDY